MIESVISWYRDICLNTGDKEYKPGPCLITTKLRVTPNLLRLRWKGNPLIYQNSAWYYFDPDSKPIIS